MNGFLYLNIEIFLGLQVFFLLILGVVLHEIKFMQMYKFNVITLILSFSTLLIWLSFVILWFSFYENVILLNYQLIIDDLTFFFKFITLFMSCLCLIMFLDYDKRHKIQAYEYLLLLLLAITGMLSMISSYDFLTMYLSIELQSLCFYIVTCIKLHSMYSIEAGLKYFILGAFSSGILLFGCSMIYGFTGVTNFEELAKIFTGYKITLFSA